MTEMRVRREVNEWTRQEVADLVARTFPAPPTALCVVFGGASSIAALGLGDTLDAHAWWTWATETERQAEVRRRQLVRDGLTLSAAALLPVDPLGKWSNWFGGRLQVDHGMLGELETLSTRIAQRYATVGAAGSLPAARSLAQSGVRLLRRESMSSRDRQRLASIAADASAMAEVDGVLERASGEIVGVEVKAAETVRDDDFRGSPPLCRLGSGFRPWVDTPRLLG
ncbi:MAG: hypothetical protein ACRDZO_12430 [Egibacteraceae bacterium]